MEKTTVPVLKDVSSEKCLLIENCRRAHARVQVEAAEQVAALAQVVGDLAARVHHLDDPPRDGRGKL